MTQDNRLGAILCPNCRKLISANSESCIHCGMKNPNMWGLASTFKKLFGGYVSFIPIISMTCVVVYLISLLVDVKGISFGGFGFLGPSLNSLYRLGATGTYPMSNGKWWSVITAIYLHGGLLHIFFNVYWIRQLGPPLEEFYGIARGFLIFTISGVVGFMVSNMFQIPFTIGASGSDFGLLAAIIYYGRKRGGTFGTALYRQVGQWAIVLFVIGFLMPAVNNYAHAGGFIGGWVAAYLLGFNEIKPEGRVHYMLALGAIVMTLFAFLMAIITP